MSRPTSSLSGGFQAGAAERALTELSGAIRAARRARDSVPAHEVSVQPGAVDFSSLDFSGWKRHSGLALFKGKDGQVRFTGNRTMVMCRPADGGVDVELLSSALGGSTRVPAEQVVSDSVGVLPGVLTLGQRRGAYVPTLRWRSMPAILSPHGDEPLAAAVELRAIGGEAKVVALEVALDLLGLRWASLHGGDEVDEATQELGIGEEAVASVTYDDAQLLSPAGGGAEAVWRRAQTLCTPGVLPSLDGARVAATDVTQFIAAAGGSAGADEVVAAPLAAAVGRVGASAGAIGNAVMGEAGRACLVALGKTLDALDADGVAAVAMEARTFRAEEGISASAGACGAFVARVLRARAASEAVAEGVASPSQRSRAHMRRSPRGSPPSHVSHPTDRTQLVDTPRSATIRRLMAEKAAEDRLEEGKGAAEPPPPGGGRAIDFDGARDGVGGTARRERDGAGVGLEQPPAQRRRVEPVAAEFAELRPRGAETIDAARVVQELETAMEGDGRITTAIADEAAGRPAGAAALTSASSVPALRAAAREWRGPGYVY